MSNLENLAHLLKQRNVIAQQITDIIGRPAQIGHIGEHIAAEIFGIELAKSAIHKGSDGVFRSGSLAGKTVNIKWYGKLESILDIREDAVPDYFLVLTGPKSQVMTSRGEARLWCIEFVFLFEVAELLPSLRARGIQIRIATSVTKETWKNSEIFPAQNNKALVLTDEQRSKLKLFGTEALGV